jgi:uncharacterized repeat protein (TIGR01451 family)
VQAPELSIAKTASSAGFEVGVAASYTLTVTNIGNAATTAVATVTDPVPAALSLGTMPPGCTNSGQIVSCIIAAGLAAGANVAFVIPVTPLAGAAGSSLSNTATVSGGGGSCFANDCSSTALVPVGSGGGTGADLSVVKSGPASVITGGQISYTLLVANAGPATAIGVSISDPTPAGLGFVTASAPCNGGFPRALGDLASGAAVTVTVTYSVPPGFAGASPLSNTASASSATPDPNPANNSSTVTTTVTVAQPAQPAPLLSPLGLALLALLLALAAAYGSDPRRRGRRI